MNTSPTKSGESAPAVQSSECACGPWWRLPLLLGLVLAAIVLLKEWGIREDAGEVANRPQTNASGAPTADRVSLTIVFGDGREQNLDDVDWYEGMTIRDLLNAAPRVSILQQGSGASAFLTTIDGVANEGAGGRNWMYSVNGERGDRSFAIYELHAGDHVLWNFAPPK